MNPLDLTGPEFLKFYAACAAAVLLALAWTAVRPAPPALAQESGLRVTCTAEKPSVALGDEVPDPVEKVELYSKAADLYVNTTETNVHELRERLERQFADIDAERPLRVAKIRARSCRSRRPKPPPCSPMRRKS